MLLKQTKIVASIRIDVAMWILENSSLKLE